LHADQLSDSEEVSVNADLEEYVSIPPPYDFMVGSPARSVDWGQGWLGYHEERVFFVEKDLETCHFVPSATIMHFDDTWAAASWLIFCGEPDRVFPFVLGEHVGRMPRPIHPKLRSALRLRSEVEGEENDG
jgi:hypothetical protein